MMLERSVVSMPLSKTVVLLELLSSHSLAKWVASGPRIAKRAGGQRESESGNGGIINRRGIDRGNGNAV